MTDRPVEVTEANFHTEVLGAKLPVLVEFWAPWCAPCKTILPQVEGLAREFAGRVKVCRVNTDENPTAGLNHRVSSIPTYLLFRDGSVVAQVVGARAGDVRAAVERAVTP